MRGRRHEPDRRDDAPCFGIFAALNVQGIGALRPVARSRRQGQALRFSVESTRDVEKCVKLSLGHFLG